MHRQVLPGGLAWILWPFLGFILVLLAATSVYVVTQWEQVAVIRFGRIIKVVKDGIHFRIPLLDSLSRFDMRVRTLDLRQQSVITKDNISLLVDAVAFIRIENPEALLTNVERYETAVYELAQTSLRDVIGSFNLDDVLSERSSIAERIEGLVEKTATVWGIDVQNVELQNVVLPPDMKRAFAVQAEAEREARAVKISAEAEKEASSLYREAAEILAQSPGAVQLRMLQTLADISKDQSNTIIFALPTETLRSAGVGGLAAMASINSSAARQRIADKAEADTDAR